MMFPRLFLALLLIVIVSSCSDTSVDPPKDPGGSDTTKTDTLGFAIISAPTDSLYYGEHAWIEVNQLGTSTDWLRMYIDTVEVTGLSIEGKKLHFIVPGNAQTGRIRLYKNDTLAKNEFTLYILPYFVNEDLVMVNDADPKNGYPGEEIVIRGYNLPTRRKDFDITLNGTELPVVKWNATMIVATIPESATSGIVTVRTYSKSTNVSLFDVLKHTGRLADDELVRKVTVSCFAMDGTMIEEISQADTSYTTTSDYLGFFDHVLLDGKATITRGDSLRITADEPTSEQQQVVNIALSSAAGKNMVSGKVTLLWRSPAGSTSDTSYRSLTVTVKDMFWKPTEGGYEIYAYGESIVDKLISIEYNTYFALKGSNTWVQRKSIKYDGASTFSKFSIRLDRYSK